MPIAEEATKKCDDTESGTPKGSQQRWCCCLPAKKGLFHCQASADTLQKWSVAILDHFPNPPVDLANITM
jgi:hypothetical protein